MKYVCLGFISAAKYEALSEAEGRQLMEECFAYDDELRRGGHFLGGEALQPAQNAVTLRIKNGSVEVTDGPYAETKEMLGGILFLEAHDLNHAISLMSRHPGVRVGPFEIRPADEGINQRIADLNANYKRNRELQLDSPRLRNQRENSQSSLQSSEQRHVTPTANSDGSPRVQPEKNTVCLWYNGDAEAAAKFYSQTFPNSAVGAVHRAPSDNPSSKAGDVLTVEFTVMGIPCLGLNGGPGVDHTWAFSFQVATEDQAETDRYWNAIIEGGGQESQCGWCKDRWGVNWQITPKVLNNAFTGSDRAAAKRAFEAMMTMKKIDVAAIEAAVRG